MSDAAARKFGGHLVLAGMISLFIAMALAVVGMFMLMRLDNPSGDTFLTFAKVLGALWLPLVGIGILTRITSRDPASQPTQVPANGDSGGSGESSPDT